VLRLSQKKIIELEMRTYSIQITMETHNKILARKLQLKKMERRGMKDSIQTCLIARILDSHSERHLRLYMLKRVIRLLV